MRKSYPKKKKNQQNHFYIPPDEQRKLIHRLNRMIGQMEALKRQIQTGKCADDLLIQISAVRGALNRFAVKILENHFVECARTCMRESSPDEDVVERMTRALSIILRRGG